MKAILFSALIAMLTATLASTSAFAKTAAELATDAKAAYDRRDFNQAGIAAAQQAADLYAQAASASATPEEKAGYLTKQSEAIYFVGDASSDNAQKIVKFDAGLKVGDQAVKLLGLTDVNKAADADLSKLKGTPAAAPLAEALYYRGINLGQWGQANGVFQSISKWPELERNMQLIELLGLQSIHDYGPYRTLGRGNFKLASVQLGGSMDDAERYLNVAFKKTLVAAAGVSRNGHNNIYYADLLHSKGDDVKSKKILQDFIKADPNQLDPNGVIELKNAQRSAQDLLKSW